jgi:hypothetical protein
MSWTNWVFLFRDWVWAGSSCSPNLEVLIEMKFLFLFFLTLFFSSHFLFSSVLDSGLFKHSCDCHVIVLGKGLKPGSLVSEAELEGLFR